MRQVTVKVEAAEGPRVFGAVAQHAAGRPTWQLAHDREEDLHVVKAQVPNDHIEGLLRDLRSVPHARITWAPQGQLAFEPDAGTVPQAVKQIQFRSPSEIYLSGLQSIGSWRGFLGYAALAAVVAWLGLHTNTVYLLTAAMLIAPFAGPSMNAALATAAGDMSLLGRSLLRYFASLALGMVVSFALSFAFGLETASRSMVDTASITVLAVVLPLAAGMAGALNLAQSDRSSLVSGAATGMLVAASLAPPVALTGMAAHLARWDLVAVALFIVVLQVVAINFAGAVIFRLAGVKAEAEALRHGKSLVFAVGAGLSALCAGALVVVQLEAAPELRRASRTKTATTVASKLAGAAAGVEFIDAEARFATSSRAGEVPLLVTAWVRNVDPAQAEERLQRDLANRIEDSLRERGEVLPVAHVIVLSGSGPAESR